MKVNSKTEIVKEKENINGLMEVTTKDNGCATK